LSKTVPVFLFHSSRLLLTLQLLPIRQSARQNNYQPAKLLPLTTHVASLMQPLMLNRIAGESQALNSILVLVRRQRD
jgi:hypothetical protein